MKMSNKDRIFGISGEDEFLCLAMEVFRYQASENPIYKRYLRMLGKSPEAIREPEEIPFLPAEFFREHRVITGKGEPELVFESSGTTSIRTSRHYVLDGSVYMESYTRGFGLFFGPPSDYCILALMPSYSKRIHSSLVYMAEGLIRQSGHPKSGFYLDRPRELLKCIRELEGSGQSYLLLGVSFALADLAESHPLKLEHAIVVETGGMKGRRREMTREELHGLLKNGFGVSSVCSEYGMTELLSQAWSNGEGIFHCPPWMRIMIRDPYDPLSPLLSESSGGINIIDLANIRSCSFIATQDIGRLAPDGGFEVLGRFDSSDIRGCNLMVG
jgi:hypothetical protein